MSNCLRAHQGRGFPLVSLRVLPYAAGSPEWQSEFLGVRSQPLRLFRRDQGRLRDAGVRLQRSTASSCTNVQRRRERASSAKLPLSICGRSLSGLNVRRACGQTFRFGGTTCEVARRGARRSPRTWTSPLCPSSTSPASALSFEGPNFAGASSFGRARHCRLRALPALAALAQAA